MVDLVKELKWSEKCDRAGMALARPRAGRGGGLEFHFSILPQSAITELVNRGLLAASYAPVNDAVEAVAPVGKNWTWYDQQSDKTKAEAQRRLMILQRIELAEKAGFGANNAVAEAAKQYEVSPATIWNWRQLVTGIAAQDRLPALAPRRVGGGLKKGIDEALWQQFKTDFLRKSAPTYAGCYARLEESAKKAGFILPTCKTLQRRLEAEVPASVIVFMREGTKALQETIPSQKRTILGLHAMEAINIDGHKWDVFVRFPAKNGLPERIARPMTIAMQDLYSRKMLAWRTGEAETSTLTRLTFGDLFKKWGIPKHVTSDNGRAFASKWITGGAKTRFRFKIKDSDPTGLLTALGIVTHWATPAHGQAKPIERSFGTLEEVISKHPLCEGAYTGKNPMAKPENYAERAIDLDVFEALIAKGMEVYNAKQGRRTEAAQGGSFDDAFFASYKVSAIGRATDEQLRLALLTADHVRANRKTGAVQLYGNTYYAPALYDLAGQMVAVRFDPDDLMKTVYIYKATGEYVCEAPIQAAVGFYDVDAAKDRAKLGAGLLKATREATRLQNLISVADLAAMMPLDTEDGPAPETPIIRPVRSRGNAVRRLAPDVAQNDQALVMNAFRNAIDQMPEPQKRHRFSIVDGGLSPNQEPERPN
ncbi:transposase domain-containing protein [Asticcacaulis sp. MM231]|uniref:transposase domain-containing protein n=1 Tax=Asticcacaulis sp. MM231 TaxID=3157666 RepID=UPI0032D56DE2